MIESQVSAGQFLGNQSYTDINGLHKLKQLGKEDQAEALNQVAKQFESMFLQQMLKEMRKAGDALTDGGIFGTNEMKFHRDMYDNQLVPSLTEGEGVGLAKVIAQQLRDRYLNQGDNLLEAREKASQTPVERNTSIPLHLAPVFHNAGAIESANEADSSDTEARPENNAATPINATVAATDSPEEFIEKLLPYARQAAEALGVDYKVLLAQSALETGWGKAAPGNNLFGIKADTRWEGDAQQKQTNEYVEGRKITEQASFRSYDDAGDSFQDYTQFIQNSKRYADALNSETPQAYIEQLQQAGYATDPNYAQKVMRVYRSDTLDSALKAQAPGQEQKP